MNYDGLVLSAVTSELQTLLTGGRLQKIRQHNESDITFEIRCPGQTLNLFFSINARYPRVYLSTDKPAVPKEAPTFCMLLRKHIDGLFISSIRQLGLDRILEIVFSAKDAPSRTIIFELMGKHSNLILLDENSRILGAIKNVGFSISRTRQILPGRDYMLPPGSSKLDILNITSEDFKSAWTSALHEVTDIKSTQTWLMNTFNGFGPFLANEMALKSSIDSQVTSSSVFDNLILLKDIIKENKYQNIIATDDAGKTKLVYPIHTLQFSLSNQHSRLNINEPLEAYYRVIVNRSAFDDERAQLLLAISRHIIRQTQILKSIERSLHEAENCDRYKKNGELILANIWQINKGDTKTTVIDYYDPETPEIAIELNEEITPQQNAERYFKRYKKAKDSITTSIQRRDYIKSELISLHIFKEKVGSAENISQLKDLKIQLINLGLFRSETIKEKAEKNLFNGEKIRQITTPEGWEILYGENAKANDYLTQRIAKPNDAWLHARSITGAHVVIRTAGKPNIIPRSVLLRAALIAAQNSDAKHSSLVTIDHTYKKHVRKPKGSVTGYVIYKNEKSIDINPKKQLEL